MYVNIYIIYISECRVCGVVWMLSCCGCVERLVYSRWVQNMDEDFQWVGAGVTTCTQVLECMYIYVYGSIALQW